MKNLITLSLTSAALLFSTLTFAAPITVHNGLLIGVNAGVGRIQTPNGNVTAGTGQSNSNYSPAYGAEIGWNWAINPNLWLGVDAGLNDDGYSKYKTTISGQTSNVKLSQKDGDIMLTAGFVADGGFNIFGKAGWAYVYQKTRGVGSNLTAFTHGNSGRLQGRTKVEMGLGYMFIDNLNVTLSYSHIFGKDEADFPLDNAKIFSSNSARLGVTYTFPMG